MKIVISGVEYGLEDSIHKASLGDLLQLKTKLNVSAKSISATFKKFNGAHVMDLLDDADVLRDLQGVIFLSRRKAGETLTVDEAGQVSFTDVTFVSEDDDEADGDAETDPKA